MRFLRDTSSIRDDGNCDKCDARGERVIEIHGGECSITFCWRCLSDAMAAVLGTDNEFPEIEVEVSGMWLPIETAPKDGTRILILCGDPLVPESPASACFAVWRCNHRTRTIGWFDEVEDDEPAYHPTHWMPLPEPPK